MTIPKKEVFALTYLGQPNSVGWPGYDFWYQPRAYGFISSADPEVPQLSEAFFANYTGFEDYPLTTPDNIVVMQSRQDHSFLYAEHFFGTRIYLQQKKSHNNSTYPGDTVDAMYEPLHPNGVPTEFSEDTIVESGYKIYPRWQDSTPYDWWNTTVPNSVWPYYSLWNPQDVNYIYREIPYGIFSFRKNSQPNGMSTVLNLSTNEYVEVQYNPANSFFSLTTDIALMVDSRLCCFNKGATISGKIVYKKAQATLTSASGGAFGYYSGFNITWGSPVPHSEVDWSVTLGEDNCILSPYEQTKFTIPQEDGYAVFVDDFYITSVTQP